MNKPLAFVLAILVLGTLLLPRTNRNQQSASPESEMTAKRQLIEQDVRRTDELCRAECLLALRQFMQGQSASIQAAKPIQPELRRLKSEHSQMQQLVWFRAVTPVEQISEGSLPGNVSVRVQPEIDKAKKTALSGVEYQSGQIHTDQGTFFVTGVPSADKRAALVNITKENILQEVAYHQQKNLRTVTYPAGKNWNIEAADSRTLKKVDVNHPEDNQGTSHYHKNEVVVRFAQPPTDEQLSQIQREIKSQAMRRLGYTYVFAADGMDAKQLMDYFQKWQVLYTEPHYLYLTNEVKPADENISIPAGEKPNDRLYAKYQWNLPIIDTESGWRIARGSKEVTVAVVDTGVDLNHPDLQGRLVGGYNVINPDNPPQDDVGHGTHVAGVISALTNNNIGVAGMTWYNPVMPVKVLDETGAGSTYAVAEGIIWAADHGAKIINLSLGNYAEAQFLHDAIRYAYDRDVLLVSASGNDNTDQPGYPAAYPEVFAVAAIDDKRNKAAFSNFGDYVDIAAPGVSIASTFTGGRYAALSGTSMASPHVAAAAALIRSANPALTNSEVMDIMRKSAIDLGTPGHDAYYGDGQIDVVNALELAVPGATAPSTRTSPVSDPPAWFRRLLDWFR